MSLLSPVLLPPEVKAYLSQGERFIKWDDVSGADLAAEAPVAAGWLPRPVGGWVYVCQDQAPVWLGRFTVGDK